MPLPAPACFRIEDDPSVKIVPIGARVPKILTLWLSFPATANLTMEFVKGAISMERSSDGVFVLRLPGMNIRAGEEPLLNTDERAAGISPIVGSEGQQIWRRPGETAEPEKEG